ncbi:hypothetical protein V8E53_009080 [Lactarius tabidus]
MDGPCQGVKDRNNRIPEGTRKRDAFHYRHFSATLLFLFHCPLPRPRPLIASARAQRYFDSPPRFQILHCLRNRVLCGTSLFVDAFAAASALRSAHPANFAPLVATPVPFHYVNDARHLHHTHPTISLGSVSASPDGKPHITAVGVITRRFRHHSRAIRHLRVLRRSWTFRCTHRGALGGVFLPVK